MTAPLSERIRDHDPRHSPPYIDWAYDASSLELHLALANKALIAHLDAAGGQEGGKAAGVTLGTSIVVGVLNHRKALIEKLVAAMDNLPLHDTYGRKADDALAALAAAKAAGFGGAK